MDSTTTYSCDTLVTGLVLQSTPVDWWCLYWIHRDMDPSIYTRSASDTELSTRVSLLILRLREVSSLSMGNYIQFGRSHESDFHGITRFGSKICHRSVTCVTHLTHVTHTSQFVTTAVIPKLLENV